MTGCDSSGTGGRVYVGNNGLHSIGIGGGFHRNTHDDPPVTHRGYTDAEGQTAYVASNKPVSISVFVLGDDHLPTKAQIRAACRNS